MLAVKQEIVLQDSTRGMSSLYCPAQFNLLRRKKAEVSVKRGNTAMYAPQPQYLQKAHFICSMHYSVYSAALNSHLM